MFSKDIFSLLGLAARARKVTCGDSLLKDIRSHHVQFVFIAEDASENTKKKYSDKCSFYHVDYLAIGTVDELSQAIGKDNRVAVGIKDKGFAKQIKSKLGG